MESNCSRCGCSSKELIQDSRFDDETLTYLKVTIEVCAFCGNPETEVAIRFEY